MPLFRKRSVPSRRASLHFGPKYLAMLPNPQTRRFLGGLQPLCGIGVTSSMFVILNPAEFSDRTADSRPGPGPRTRPRGSSCRLPAPPCRRVPPRPARRRACSCATHENRSRRRSPTRRRCPAIGDRHDRVVERRVDMGDAIQDVLLDLLFRLRCCHLSACKSAALIYEPGRRGPLRVRALVRVRWPRNGRPRRCRMPR